MAKSVQTTTPTLPSTGFIRIKQVLQFIPVSKASWYNGIKSGKYPAPVKLGEHTSAWRVTDIQALIARLGA